MKERKRFVGKINTDADVSVFPEEEMLNAVNISHVIAQDGSIAAMKGIQGNRKVSYTPVYPSRYPIGGAWKVVGSFAEDDKNRVYYFVYNQDSTNHHLLCYFKTEDKIRLVLHGKLLELDGTPITGIDKIGDTLYWVADNAQPKKINVERGMVTHDSYLSQAAPYQNLVAKDITIIKPGPMFAPVWNKTNTDQPYNFIDDYAFQFAYQYVYRDKELSVFSPYSKIANYNAGEDTFDTIVIQIPTKEAIPNEVDKVRLVVRSGNIGTFFIIKQWVREQDSSLYDSHNAGTNPLTYTFHNNQNGVAVAEEESAKPFDQVPIVSRALIAAKNRLFLGNNIFGYNAVNKGGISAKYSVSEAGSGTTTVVSASYVYLSLTQVPTSEYPYPAFYERIYLRVEGSGESDGYYSLDSYGLQHYGFSNGLLPTNIIVTADMKVLSLSDGDNTTLLIEDLQKTTAGWGIPTQDPISFEINLIREYVGNNPIVIGIPGINTDLIGASSFKSSSKYQVGIVFYDFAGRNAGVYTTPSCMVSFPDRTYVKPNIYQNIEVSLNFTSEEIPDWATHYQIVRTRNLTYQSFIQGFGTSLQYVGKDKDGNWQFGETDASVFSETFNEEKVQGIAMDLSTIISNGIGYAYSEGDFVRLYMTDDKKYILPVLTQVGKYIILSAKDIGTLTTSGLQHVFEIASPRKGFQEEPFYEIGGTYSVLSPGTDSRSLQATTVVIEGDVYVIKRGTLSNIVEAMNKNDDHWKEWLSDIGRPNSVIHSGGRSIRPTSISYSNVYVQDSEINGLSSFDTLDYKDLDYTMGAIRKLVLTNRIQEYGSVMLCICESDTASIYLGENRIVDNADGSILATSGDVIGTVNVLKGSNGTIHPESVYERDGTVVFADAVQGKIIKYDNNGLSAISENGMAKFFSSILYSIDSTERRIYGTFDKRTGAYLLNIPPGYVDSVTLVDKENRQSPHHPVGGVVYSYLPQIDGWNTSITISPEWMDSTKDCVITWINGELYVHDNPSINEFYGVKHDSLVSFVYGIPQMYVKTPEAITIEGSQAPDWVHLRNEHPYIQSTDLYLDEFVGREGIYAASFYRDRLTPGYPDYDTAMMRGVPVRGQFIKCAILYHAGDFHVTGITISYDRSLGNQMLAKES